MSSCSNDWMRSQRQSSGDYFRPVEQQADPVAPLVIRVTGYAALSNAKNLSEAQRRLLAMRGSQVDAYRTMAERVYGTAIQGATTVRDMVVENDRLRTWVESSLQGARVVSTDVLPDGSVETVLEMVIDQGFRNCLQTNGNQRMNVDCRIPLGSHLGMAKPVQTEQNRMDVGSNPYSGSAPQPDMAAPSSTPKGAQSGFYFIE
ncbi:LPP20 family lipoprotein [Parathalassolituus penaei]|uniref:LPP20 family lipoprotein n=1 Tax=Parathalassolituus penaei TaxID=2997323 RepID=A0A9X3IQJ9_9GAMM|nr:LPP20 family lipoprotein [Parathalassolituus penaei]MCY0963876.1 LPP20 family lipoprotein [Parathalassolituus penaei]